MNDKFRNKYRTSSARASWWKYGNHAAYFITICTQGRKHYFGEINANKRHTTAIGTIAEIEWLKTPSIRPDMNLELHEFVVMPNHFHAIIVIGENQYNSPVKTETAVETPCMASLQSSPPTSTLQSNNETNSIKNKFGPQPKNLASIIRGFKSSVTTYARKNNIQFGWQSSFHDHIIQDDDSFQRIRNYIIANPKNWHSDKFNY